MKTASLVGGLMVMVASLPVMADSYIRVKCDDADVGAEVYLNGRRVGNCPLDVLAPAGAVELRARKIVNKDYEQFFTKTVQVYEGSAQKVELVMSAPQLTQEAEFRTQRRAAEAGDAAACLKVAGYYEAGTGVARSMDVARIWRDAAEKITAQQQIKAANAGDVDAMLIVAKRYASGSGVSKDLAQAQAWAAKARAGAEAANARTQKIAEAIRVFENL